MLTELMQKKAVTKYQLAKNSGIPYTTVSDIVSGKAQLEKCSAETIYRLSKELDALGDELKKEEYSKNDAKSAPFLEKYHESLEQHEYIQTFFLAWKNGRQHYRKYFPSDDIRRIARRCCRRDG